MKRIVLVNPNTNAGTTARMVEIAREHLAAGFGLEGATSAFGAPLIANEDQLAVAAQAVAAMAPALNAASDGVIVSAFGDPGLDALRTQLSVPVVGIGACAMRAAARGGRRFSVVTTTPGLVRAIALRAQRLGLGRELASIRLTEGALEALMEDEERLTAALQQVAEAAIADDGAEAVVIGGGPLASVARRLRGGFSVPVIEPIPAAVEALQIMLGAGEGMRKAGASEPHDRGR